MRNNVLALKKSDRKLAILIDPDKHSADQLFDFVSEVARLQPDYILLGGSLIYKSSVDRAAKQIKATTNLPLVLFPGHFTQLTDSVDFVLLLSLISGRNADLLIGQHVLAAPMLKKLSNKLCPTGYMLIDGGNPTSVGYMSNTQPIPADKLDIAVCTAIAGEAIGLSCIYLDAGSGAMNPISQEMIREVSESVDIPIIVGGGIKEVSHIEKCWNNGANLVVVGNAMEENSSLAADLAKIKADLSF
ncbi:MAG: geranylgeranylglyceryl/heptaprenylglyceryl phosphate synthase [Flavobacteriales bacterium]